MSELVAVFGDKNSHNDGDLQCDNNPGKMYVQGKLVALKDCSALADSLSHTPDQTKPSQGTGKLWVNGIQVHLNGQSRYCGASTIVTNQSKLYSG